MKKSKVILKAKELGAGSFIFWRINMTKRQTLDRLNNMEQILTEVGPIKDGMYPNKHLTYIYWIADALYGVLTDIYKRKEQQ